VIAEAVMAYLIRVSDTKCVINGLKAGDDGQQKAGTIVSHRLSFFRIETVSSAFRELRRCP
jgi:hypothetical protein